MSTSVGLLGVLIVLGIVGLIIVLGVMFLAKILGDKGSNSRGHEPKGLAPGGSPEAWEQDQEIRQLALSGDKIAAIKLCRARYGFGLKESKDRIDSIR